jgi:PadR family transcriptional regulator PadR
MVDQEASSRERLLAYLAEQGGSVESREGRGLTKEMAIALGYVELSALNAMLGRLERQGLITREVRGRRTYRIALTQPREDADEAGAPAGPQAGPEGGELAAIRRFEQELSHPRGLLRASILLLLNERPGHGYDLIERLKPFGFERDDPSRIYRALRWLEGAGLVRPNWETPAAGPARRVYELTPAGRRTLQACAASLRQRSEVLEDHLGRYGVGSMRPMPKRKRSFEVLVEAKLSVEAFDESSAQRKVERAFGRPRMIDGDVWTTGQVWIYEATPQEASAEG